MFPRQNEEEIDGSGSFLPVTLTRASPARKLLSLYLIGVTLNLEQKLIFGMGIALLKVKIRTGTATSNGLGLPPSDPIRGVPNFDG